MVAVVAVDMVEPGEVVDLVVGMWAGESDEIDCENGEGLLATVCNECCEKSSRYMLDMTRKFHAFRG